METPKSGPLKFVRFESNDSTEPRYQRRPPEPIEPRDPAPPPPFFPTASPPPQQTPQPPFRIPPFNLESFPNQREPPHQNRGEYPPPARSKSLRSWPTFSSRASEGGDSHRVFEEEMKWRKTGVFDPHGRLIRQWNKVFVVACLVAAAVDPLFFFLVEVDIGKRCMRIEPSFAITVTVLRCMTDMVYFLQMLLQFRVAYMAPSNRIFGRGELVVDKRSIADHYLRGNFALDFVAWLPVPQFVLWVVIPSYSQPGTASAAKNWLRFVVILQYIPRIVRMIPIQTSLRRPGTLAFETASSGFVINLMIFLLASHVIAAAWYLLGVERVDHCWREVCAQEAAINCSTRFFDCASVNTPERLTWSTQTNVTRYCVDQSVQPGQGFNYGIYQPILKIIATLGVKRYFYSLWWGLKNLTSMGQPLIPSTFTGEIWFCIIIALTGMLLLAMLVGNMQKYLQSLGRRVEDHRSMLRDTEAWMKHRQLPPDLRKRVRSFDRFKWSAMHGVDEERLLRQLPEDLARDVKRHLCLDLVKKVPLFENLDKKLTKGLDSLFLDAICQRLKPQLFIRGGCIIRQGDPAFRMLFIIRGQLESTEYKYGQTNTLLDSVTLTSGDFVGDELMTWCLDPRPKQYYPSSLRTVVADTPVEAFSLNADDLRYVTGHFLTNAHRTELRRALRFYSPHWRIWGALAIQAAWRRYQRRKRETATAGTSTAEYISMFLENARRVAAREEAEAVDFDGALTNRNGTVRSSRTFKTSGNGNVGGNGSSVRQRARRPTPLETDDWKDEMPAATVSLARVPTPTEPLTKGHFHEARGESSGSGFRAASLSWKRPPSVKLPKLDTVDSGHERVPTPTEQHGEELFGRVLSGEPVRSLSRRRRGNTRESDVENDPLHVNPLGKVPSIGRALLDDGGSSREEDLAVPRVGADANDRVPTFGRALQVTGEVGVEEDPAVPQVGPTAYNRVPTHGRALEVPGQNEVPRVDP